MAKAVEATAGNDDIARQMAAVLAALKQGLGDSLVALVLFGSRARGEADEASDWDLLLIAQDLPQKPFQRHLHLKQMLPADWRGRVAILAKTPEGFESYLTSLFLDIALDGIILYDKERWDTIRAGLHRMDVSQVRARWLIPLFQLLDFDPVYLRGDTVLDEAGELRFPLSHHGECLKSQGRGVEGYTAELLVSWGQTTPMELF